MTVQAGQAINSDAIDGPDGSQSRPANSIQTSRVTIPV
jgi:hypothetical protein